MPTDEELVANYRTGKEASFDTLVERHLSGVYALAFRLVGSASEAEDIAQEAFVKAWRALSRYDKESASFKTWLMRIARNTAIDHLRKKKPVPFSDLSERNENASFDVADEGSLPDELAARAFEAREVEQAVSTLSLPYREVIVLYYGEGLTFDEMAQVLDTSANTLKSRHRRALATLRSQLHRGRDA